MALSALFKSCIFYRKGILAVFLLGLVLPASAKIVLIAPQDSEWLDSPHYLTRAHRNYVSGTLMSSSPLVNHHLRRAHAWSNYGTPNGEAVLELGLTRALIVNNRPTSLESNMARARAYSASSR